MGATSYIGGSDERPVAIFRPILGTIGIHMYGYVSILDLGDAERLHQSLGEALLIARGAHPAQTGQALPQAGGES